jgi:hypothetical protein
METAKIESQKAEAANYANEKKGPAENEHFSEE